MSTAMNAIEMIKERRSVRQYKNATYGFEEGDHAQPTARHEVKDIM